MNRAMTIDERFWSKVDRRTDGECWPWLGYRQYGYGITTLYALQIRAHVLSWIIHHGQGTGGLLIRHTCDNQACVNPGHLILGTDADNVADRVARNRSARGERNGTAKLKAADIPAIRASADSIRALARRFGVTYRAIWAAKNGQTWRCVASVDRDRLGLC